jgi:hypothetical protein
VPTLARLLVRDRTPYHNGAGFCWYDAARRNPQIIPSAASLPSEVFALLNGHGRSAETRWKSYETPHAAADAVARAACRFVRENL